MTIMFASDRRDDRRCAWAQGGWEAVLEGAIDGGGRGVQTLARDTSKPVVVFMVLLGAHETAH